MQSNGSLSNLILGGRNARYRKDLNNPDTLLTVFLEYLTLMQSGVWKKSEVLKSGDNAGRIVTVPVTPPLTYQTFALFSGLTKDHLKDLASDENLSETVTLIMSAIEGHQLEGAAIGAFNAGLIQRLQGLADKQDDEALTGAVKQIIGMTVV